MQIAIISEKAIIGNSAKFQLRGMLELILAKYWNANVAGLYCIHSGVNEATYCGPIYSEEERSCSINNTPDICQQASLMVSNVLQQSRCCIISCDFIRETLLMKVEMSRSLMN